MIIMNICFISSKIVQYISRRDNFSYEAITAILVLHINPMMRWLILIGGGRIGKNIQVWKTFIFIPPLWGIFFSASIQSQDLPTNTFVEQFHRFVKYLFWYSWNWIHTIHTYILSSYHLYHHHVLWSRGKSSNYMPLNGNHESPDESIVRIIINIKNYNEPSWMIRNNQE